MATLIQRFTGFLSQENLFLPKDEILLAVSGGVDSVVLAALFQEAAIDFAMAHCNFQLRGAESERDKGSIFWFRIPCTPPVLST